MNSCIRVYAVIGKKKTNFLSYRCVSACLLSRPTTVRQLAVDAMKFGKISRLSVEIEFHESLLEWRQAVQTWPLSERCVEIARRPHGGTLEAVIILVCCKSSAAETPPSGVMHSDQHKASSELHNHHLWDSQPASLELRTWGDSIAPLSHADRVPSLLDVFRCARSGIIEMW